MNRNEDKKLVLKGDESCVKQVEEEVVIGNSNGGEGNEKGKSSEVNENEEKALEGEEELDSDPNVKHPVSLSDFVKGRQAMYNKKMGMMSLETKFRTLNADVLRASLRGADYMKVYSTNVVYQKIEYERKMDVVGILKMEETMNPLFEKLRMTNVQMEEFQKKVEKAIGGISMFIEWLGEVEKASREDKGISPLFANLNKMMEQWEENLSSLGVDVLIDQWTPVGLELDECVKRIVSEWSVFQEEED